MYVGIVLWAFNLFYSVGMDSNPAHGIIFSYAIYLCFGIPPYFIGAYHRLIFRLAQNDLLSHDEASSGLLKHDCYGLALSKLRHRNYFRILV